MKDRYTPGPWELVEIGDKCKHLCPAKDGTSILTVALEHGEDSEDPTYFGAVYNRHDAYIISAAPDLYEALKEARDALCSHPDYQDAHSMKMFDDAIAKAEGRENR